MESEKKTLIFCFDGTLSDPEDVEGYAKGESITNILKLHILFGGSLGGKSEIRTKTKGGSRQQSFYYKGSGTYGGWLSNLFNVLFASDNTKILKKAKEDLGKHYERNDHVLIFGFSRGAALARKFAANVKKKLIKKKPKVEGLEINFLGVFDTVDTVFGFEVLKTLTTNTVFFKNRTIGKDVKKAVHLLALYEDRTLFKPTLSDYDQKKITEVWFPGFHSDVGGGHRDDGLSDLTLEYMIKKIEKEHVGNVWTLGSEEINYDKLNKEGDTQITKDAMSRKPSVTGELHDPGWRLKQGYRKVRIAGKRPEGVYPMVHESVQLRYKADEDYRPQALRGTRYIVIGKCEDPDKAEPKDKSLKYVVTADDNQIGDVRQGVSDLGVE